MTSSGRIRDALRDYTVPLETTDPGNEPTGRDFLAESIEAATVVGLGEATHGTREFSRLIGIVVTVYR